ncbi:STE like transcription factor-domain-containing protein [Radiomyces spectabilis]|uniref:STE like transcription factor-domain-containing protein n=1 Tax=Radiomyces spectabilis TaxID=64574 RepID=UPI00221FC900|nr:STE like transcription factor-domain-containing protein [Radiomyces spectabilis]KAI8364707.1 STE like transcription factor-domain-containing protein [Radiomyces spectabilis]
MTSPVKETVLPLPPPTQENISSRLQLLNGLKQFLATAPANWDIPVDEIPIKRHAIPTGESVSCVKWSHDYFISGTDIVRCLTLRFHLFGRPVKNLKKFEEGVFSDLRNLKPGADATLEEPKSPFLDLLYKHGCIRTQKKQKVFRWYSVPHDRLFLDALERDLKREKLGQDPTSYAIAEPSLSISLDATQSIFDDFRKNLLSDLELNACLSGVSICSQASSPSSPTPTATSSYHSASSTLSDTSRRPCDSRTTSVFGEYALFEGSPMYKQRRRRTMHGVNRTSTESVPDRENLHPSTVWWPYDRPFSSRNDTRDDTRYYTCPLNSCAKVFKRLEHLKRHVRTHTMERPYLCDLCGKRFSRSDNLAQHKKTHKRRHVHGLNDGHSDHSDDNDGNDHDDSNYSSSEASDNDDNDVQGTGSHGFQYGSNQGHSTSSFPSGTHYTGYWTHPNVNDCGLDDPTYTEPYVDVFSDMSASTPASTVAYSLSSSCNASPTFLAKHASNAHPESETVFLHTFQMPIDEFMEGLMPAHKPPIDTPTASTSTSSTSTTFWNQSTPSNEWQNNIDWKEYVQAQSMSMASVPSHPPLHYECAQDAKMAYLVEQQLRSHISMPCDSFSNIYDVLSVNTPCTIEFNPVFPASPIIPPFVPSMCPQDALLKPRTTSA